MIVSDQTPTREGLCVYCGTSRSVAKPICPSCGHTWIDTIFGEELPPLTPEIVAASIEERQALGAAAVADEPDPGTRRRPWGLLLGALLGLTIVAIALSAILGSDGDDNALATTTTIPATTTPADTTVVTTTSPTTTSPTTTATPTTSTTTTTTTTLPPIEAAGSPVAIQDLTLGAFALGPFSLNSDTAYLGRLVASLGQPDSGSVAGTDSGLCAGEEGVAYTWDGFTAIFRTDGDSEALVGYRLDATGSDHPTQSITSRSGLEVGHTVATLDAIYLQSGLAFTEIDGTLHFVLLRSSDNATLLWGPVSNSEPDGFVEGIYSPRACDGGPFATP